MNMNRVKRSLRVLTIVMYSLFICSENLRLAVKIISYKSNFAIDFDSSALLKSTSFFFFSETTVLSHYDDDNADPVERCA